MMTLMLPKAMVETVVNAAVVNVLQIPTIKPFFTIKN
jgi:hypothetical protein